MRKWLELPSPKLANDYMGCYNHDTWLKKMDRCWMSNDGYQVTSRIIFTEWGKVEHAAITKSITTDIENLKGMTFNGESDIPWKIKQEIKNELFGEDRIAIEVFPKESNLIDASDTYHLWIMPKGFKMPFGIHPTKDVQCKTLDRGVPKNPGYLAQNYERVQNGQF